jgi:glutathione S-transferase
MPTVGTCLETLGRALSKSGAFLVGPELSLADYFMLPIIHGFSFAPETQQLYPRFPSIVAWFGPTQFPGQLSNDGELFGGRASYFPVPPSGDTQAKL